MLGSVHGCPHRCVYAQTALDPSELHSHCSDPQVSPQQALQVLAQQPDTRSVRTVQQLDIQHFLLVCVPSLAADIPLMATVTYLPLLALQCVLAAFATCIHQENRVGFALASSALFGVAVHIIVSAAFDMKFRQVQRTSRPPARSDTASTDFDTGQESEVTSDE